MAVIADGAVLNHKPIHVPFLPRIFHGYLLTHTKSQISRPGNVTAKPHLLLSSRDHPAPCHPSAVTGPLGLGLGPAVGPARPCPVCAVGPATRPSHGPGHASAPALHALLCSRRCRVSGSRRGTGAQDFITSTCRLLADTPADLQSVLSWSRSPGRTGLSTAASPGPRGV